MSLSDPVSTIARRQAETARRWMEQRQINSRPGLIEAASGGSGAGGLAVASGSLTMTPEETTAPNYLWTKTFTVTPSISVDQIVFVATDVTFKSGVSPFILDPLGVAIWQFRTPTISGSAVTVDFYRYDLPTRYWIQAAGVELFPILALHFDYLATGSA
jgi:hypothetical protein